MIKYLRTLPVIFLLVFGWSAIAVADAFTEGKRAYEAGDYVRAIKLLRPVAVAGDPRAQQLLGDAYSLGDGVKRDKKKALQWLERSAAQDYTPGLRSLGMLLIGGFIDAKRGRRVLQTAAERGDAMAQWALGFYMRRENWGVSDNEASRKWLLKAAEQKYSLAVTELIHWYLGAGDWVEAHKWEIVGQRLLNHPGPLLQPGIRHEMSKAQIVEAKRRAAAWLTAHGVKSK